MQDSTDSNVKKVNKKVSKMSKNQKAAATANPTPETYRESPQNARLDTSESDEESVSEVKDNSLAWIRRNFSATDERMKIFSTSQSAIIPIG